MFSGLGRELRKRSLMRPTAEMVLGLSEGLRESSADVSEFLDLCLGGDLWGRCACRSILFYFNWSILYPGWVLGPSSGVITYHIDSTFQMNSERGMWSWRPQDYTSVLCCPVCPSCISKKVPAPCCFLFALVCRTFQVLIT